MTLADDVTPVRHSGFVVLKKNPVTAFFRLGDELEILLSDVDCC